MLPFRIIVVLVGVIAIGSLQADFGQPNRGSAGPPVALGGPVTQSFFESPLPSDDQAKIQSISTSQWLGTMAPVAISPFFGITCLAGMSQFGGDYLPTNNFISNNAVLKNQFVFWVFLALTLLTSLPRLTKVSKPFAQAMDQLEAYAGIVTIVILRFAAAVPSDPEPELAVAMGVVQMGWMTLPVDVLFSIAAIINIVVINSVKFFFEVLVWLIPIPFVDALLEVTNKSLCLALVALYSYNPLLATVVNLILFVACLYIFKWAKRHATYWRTLITDLILVRFWPGFGKWNEAKLVGFVHRSIDSIPAKAKVVLEVDDSGWRLIEQRWLLPGRIVELPKTQYSFQLVQGIVSHQVQRVGTDIAPLTISLSTRYSNHLPEIASRMGFVPVNREPSSSLVAELGS